MAIIGDIHLGFPDAKSDLMMQQSAFLKEYVVPPNLNLSSFLEGNKCFITGNKGMGKTAFLRFLDHEVHERNHATKTAFILFEQEYLEHYYRSKNEGTASSNGSAFFLNIEKEEGFDIPDFTSLWRWHFFMAMIRINDASTENERIFVKDDVWRKFEAFVLGVLKEPYRGKISAKTDFEFPFFKMMKEQISIDLTQFKMDRREYTFPQAMKEATKYFRQLSRRNTPFYLFVDELDVCRDREERYIRDLCLTMDLICEVDWLNQEIVNQNWERTKVIGAIRPEILNAIEGKLGSKIKRIVSGKDFALRWDFNTQETFTAPFMEIFLKRIEMAESNNGERNGTALERYRRWFPEHIKGLDATQYIRSITWSKPRDMVRLLNDCINARGNLSAFTSVVFDSAMLEYSEGSYEEIKGELEASYTSSEIEDIFNCFWGLPVRFTKQDFMKNADGSQVVRAKGTDKVLSDLYRVGAIGQIVGSRLLWYHYGDKRYNPRGLHIVHTALIWHLCVNEEDNLANAPVLPIGEENKDYKDFIEGALEEAQKQESEKEAQEQESEKGKSLNLGDINARGEDDYKAGKFEEAVEWFRKAADQGYVQAQYKLGWMYNFGLGVKQDDEMAVKWYRKAADQGNALAQHELGEMYKEGRGVKQDDRAAVEWVRKAAEQGNAQAQYSLGEMYKEGRGVRKNDGMAAQWYQKAAKQGYESAQHELASMYLVGRGVKQDDGLAAQWFRKVAEQGNASAQCTLGWMYYNGRGVKQDDEMAVEWYRKAAKQGYDVAQFNLGVMYHEGRGVKQNDELAVEWFLKAADQGYAEAQCNLGVIYFEGRGGKPDDGKALEWFLKAAGQGHEKAQYILGVMYQEGLGVKQDDKKAVEWYQKSAEQGYAEGQCNLGWMYDRGRGVKQDDGKAAQWFRKAAEQGFAVAQFNLATKYQLGLGVKQNDGLAVQWYRKAALQNLVNAQCNLGEMYKNGRGVKKDDGKAVEWYRKAAEQGFARAQLSLGEMYEHGRGVSKSRDEALKWYQKAAEQGDEDAKAAVKRLEE